MLIEVWAAFVAASVAILVIPGPTLVLVCGYALSSGRSAAVQMAVGVALGDLVAMTAAFVGLGALLSTSATLFTALKWAGALYLFYLGLKLWRAPTTLEGAETASAGRSGLSLGWSAFAVTATNPKSILFFVAFAPQFIDPAAPFAPQAAILIATFVVLAAANAVCFALLAARLRRRLTRPGALALVNKIGGGALMAMAAMAAAARRV